MAAQKARLPKFTTPKGIAKYPWLSKPDTQFNPTGVYKVSLLIPKANARELIDKLDTAAGEALTEARANAKSPAIAKQITLAPCYHIETDDEGEETGNIEFRFKQNALVKFQDGTTKEMKPFIFDAQGKQMQVCPNVYGGSVLRINFSPVGYYNASSKSAGVSLRMNAVQIMELVTGGGSAAGFGFATEEDGFDSTGFSAPAETPVAETPEASSTDY
jgi:hypothetical protein